MAMGTPTYAGPEQCTERRRPVRSVLARERALRDAHGRATDHRPRPPRPMVRQAPRRAHAEVRVDPAVRYRRTSGASRGVQRRRATVRRRSTSLPSALPAPPAARRRTRHRGVIAAMCSVAPCCGLAGGWTAGRHRGAARASIPGVVAVLPFASAAAQRSVYLRESMLDLLNARFGTASPDGRAPHDAQRMASCGRGTEGGPVGGSLAPAGRRARCQSHAARKRHRDATGRR